MVVGATVISPCTIALNSNDMVDDLALSSIGCANATETSAMIDAAGVTNLDLAAATKNSEPTDDPKNEGYKIIEVSF